MHREVNVLFRFCGVSRPVRLDRGDFLLLPGSPGGKVPSPAGGSVDSPGRVNVEGSDFSVASTAESV